MMTIRRVLLVLLILLFFGVACGNHDGDSEAKALADDDDAGSGPGQAQDDDDNDNDDNSDRQAQATQPRPALTCWEPNGAAATSVGMTPKQEPGYYIEQSLKYFDTLASDTDPHSIPNYSQLVARWEWPPWLKLTGWGREAMIVIDLLLKLYPTTIPERECEAFDVQPFGRCHVVFYYGDEPCSIYEEFTFNDQGEMTFIEAWSDIPGLLPTDDPNDYWAQGPAAHRLSTRLPGLGNATGLINLDGECLRQAAAQDADIADFVHRARHPVATWIREFIAVGADMMRLGCR